MSVKQRYADGIDFREYEAKVQKLINAHVACERDACEITPQVNIFDREKFQAEVDKLAIPGLEGRHDRASHQEDYHREDGGRSVLLSALLEDPRRRNRGMAGRADLGRRMFEKVIEVMNAVRDRKGDDLPPELIDQDIAKAFYGVVNDVFGRAQSTPPMSERSRPKRPWRSTESLRSA